MSKRKEFESDDFFSREFTTKVSKKYESHIKKHTLDSDEEDFNDDAENVMNDDDFEGEEAFNNPDGEVRMTAFNMEEEKELGHFDRDGHFIWKNEKEVRDNWLDNIDWHKIKANSKFKEEDGKVKGLGDESDSEEEDEKIDEIGVYREIIKYMKPKENINKALRRLGGDLSKLSSVERLKRKKAGTLQQSKEVTDLTELANKILNTGNMDIYQETFEQITQKLDNNDKKIASKVGIVEADTDMFSDAFEEKSGAGDANTSNLKSNLKSTSNLLSSSSLTSSNPTSSNSKSSSGLTTNPTSSSSLNSNPTSAPSSSIKAVSFSTPENDSSSNELLWEFKWEQNKDKTEGPYSTEQMFKWSQDGHFKTGVWVRRIGADDANFYSSNRIDFDLYL